MKRRFNTLTHSCLQYSVGSLLYSSSLGILSLHPHVHWKQQSAKEFFHAVWPIAYNISDVHISSIFQKSADNCDISSRWCKMKACEIELLLIWKYRCEFGISWEFVLENDLDIWDILLIDAFPENLLCFLSWRSGYLDLRRLTHFFLRLSIITRYSLPSSPIIDHLTNLK